MSLGFKTQFLNKNKETDDKNEKTVMMISSANGNKLIPSKAFIKIEQPEGISLNIQENNRDKLNTRTDKNSNYNTSSFNVTNTNDSKIELLKSTSKNIFESLNTKQNDEFLKQSGNLNNCISSSDSSIEKESENKSVNIKHKNSGNLIFQDKTKTYIEDILPDVKIENSVNPENIQNLQNDNRTISKREKICDSDTEEEGSDNEKEICWVIMPDNSFKRVYDIIIAIIIMYSSIVLPYKLAFLDYDLESDVYVDNIINGFLSLDIVLNFISAYIDTEDNVIKNPKKIMKSYLTSWFVVDLVSVLPISYMTPIPSKSQYNVLARLSRLPKLYRLVRLIKLFRMVKILKRGNVNRVTKFFLEKLKVNANIERLIYFILGFLLLNHLAACIWYFVAKMEDFNPDCWVTRLGYLDSSNMDIYIVSYYWTLTTVTTVGYGDINAGTTVERIYNLFIMSFGVLMYSFAIGSLSSIVSTLDAKTAEMNQKLQILASIKKEFSLDQDIYEKVRKVIKYDLSRNQKDKMNFLQELPNKLRIELSQIMHDTVIQKMYFFKDQPSDFIAYVAPLLKPVKFSQNDFLYKEGDMIDEMYFVSKGTVSFCLGKHFMGKEVKEIKKHNNFGEIEMCLNEKLKYNIRVKSRNCELFVLKKNDFLRLSVNFKEFIEKFLQRSLMIYLRFNDEKNKISKLLADQNKLHHGIKNVYTKSKTDELEMISENEKEDSEEYDIFGDHSQSEERSSIHQSQTDLNKSGNEEYYKNDNNLNNTQSSADENSINREAESSRKKVPLSFNLVHNTGSKNKLKSSMIGEDISRNNNYELMNIFNNGRISSNHSKKDLSMSSSNSKLPNNNLGINTNNIDADREIEDLDNHSSVKNHLNSKFVRKVEKIIDFLEKNKVDMETSEDNPDNPLNLLKRLKTLQDLSVRNELIDKIENIMTDILNIDDKK